MGKKVEDLSAGDTIKVNGHKLKVTTVRDEGESVRIVAEGKYGRIQESWERGQQPS